MRDFGADVIEIRQGLETLRRAAPALLKDIEGMPSPRGQTFTARDNVTIPELSKAFDQFVVRDDSEPSERDPSRR